MNSYPNTERKNEAGGALVVILLLVALAVIAGDVVIFIQRSNLQEFCNCQDLFTDKKYEQSYKKLEKLSDFGVGSENIKKLQKEIIDEMLTLVKDAIKQKSWTKAEERVEKVLALVPKNDEALTIKEELPNLKTFHEAEVLFSQKDYDGAWKKLESCGEKGVGRSKILGLKKQIIEDMLSEANSAIEYKDWTKAQALLEKVLSFEPANEQAKTLKRVLNNRKAFHEAEELFIQGKYEESWKKLAECTEEGLGNEKISALKEQILAEMTKIVQNHVDKKEWDDAWVMANKIVALDPKKTQVRTLVLSAMAETTKEHIAVKSWNKAGELATKILSLQPDYIDAKKLLDIINPYWVKKWKELKTLEGHKDKINCITFSKDGKLLASASSDNTAKVWDTEKGQAITTIEGHTTYFVWSVAFSPDGKILATASEDKTVKLWDIKTGNGLKTLEGHLHPVYSVAFSNDGKLLASGSWNGVIKIWDVESGKEIKEIKGKTFHVWSLAFSSDGKILASGGVEKIIRFWNINDEKEEFTLEGHGDSVWSVIFSPDWKKLATASSDKSVKLWDIETKKEIASFAGHTDFVRSVVSSPEAKVLVSGSEDKTVKCWDIETGKELVTFSGHTEHVRSVAFHPSGKIIASASFDKTIKLWGFKAD